MLKKLFAGIICWMTLAGAALAAVNINSATQTELETLNGIGPSKAKAILEHRSKYGNFKTVEELGRVKGIGEKTLARLRPDLTVSAVTATKAAPVDAPKQIPPPGSPIIIIKKQ